MKDRVIGFDLARAYAIFGMFIVNFNTVFGSHQDTSVLGKFLTLFNGNSSSVFVILAGMVLSLMSNKPNYNPEEKRNIKNIIHKRSWFLFIIGLLLYTWWSADILHFYAGYMHIAILVIFLPKKYYLWFAFTAIVIFHILLLIIPYEQGWNFDTLSYTDFWTLEGFLRNTFYNGWNPIFPWVAYFLLGMWLGRLDWQNSFFKKYTFLTGLIIYISIYILQETANKYITDKDLLFYLQSDYIPPFLPFMLSTSAFSLMIISFCMFLGERIHHLKITQVLVNTGKMTLTHYISHLTIGMIIFSFITNTSYQGTINTQKAIAPYWILLFSIIYFLLSILLSYFWLKKYKHGIFETFMRKFSG
ncbi:MAG: DUF418 domain-containing protein [Raineya sp.]|jgi:uncharacterized membrane protein YeiB|nr:DUF418 domain-containing protein [Raineya sp.]